MNNIYVKEPKHPVEGEFSLDQFGSVVVFKNGKWVKNGG